MARKRSSTTGKETKPQRLAREVAKAVGAGVEWHLETVDFADPNRPKTCLEVDFPILPINHIAAIEGNAGKPIYQMSKWWARRRSSVFRSMLIAAATKAPDDPAEAAKLVWDAYYGNHQKNEAFGKLKVADIFMGGGTTVVEGARLGMQMYGNDYNPVAWLVVKNELAQVDPKEVRRLLDRIEAEVKPQIMPFYACDCPRGHKGKWTKKSTRHVMGPDFDPLKLSPEERCDYEYQGPEIIYTFWCKHGTCRASGCDHRTPVMTSPVVAVKTLTVKSWTDVECGECGQTFDVDNQDARIAPAALFMVSPTEKPYTVREADGTASCPHCGHHMQKTLGGKPKNKGIDLTLLVHPEWLKGSKAKALDGNAFGGSVTDTAEATAAWNRERAKSLKLIEVRGPLPDDITCPDGGGSFFTDERGGTVPKKSTLSCREETCGREQDVLTIINETGKTAPVAAYVIQGHCPECESQGIPYGGRFFSAAPFEQFNSATLEWSLLSDGELNPYWPKTRVPTGLETSVRTPLHKYQYKNWSDFFNPRQLLVHSRLLRAISEIEGYSQSAKQLALGAFQQYLRNNNMFCIWNVQRDTTEPFFSKNNFQPPTRPVENGVFNSLGRGNWGSCTEVISSAAEWSNWPWEIVTISHLKSVAPAVVDEIGGKSTKTYTSDPVLNTSVLSCGTSTDLTDVPPGSFDIVVTDPPFGDIMQYGELSGFFYAWLRLMLRQPFPAEFDGENPPTTLEAVENGHRHGKGASNLYGRLLTECWSEAHRILKPGGILAFTFHHDKDGPWIAVLESLFNAGFYLEAAYPIRSDETKGEGSSPGTFGAQKVEFDIIHVCRKRSGEPQQISWARLRRLILQDVRQLKNLLEQHHNAGLPEADLQVIRRGKALEYYSRHYGKVFVERGREFPVKDALLAINQMLEEETDATTEAPPAHAEAYTRQFFRLFADRDNLPRDQMQKHLRGTGVSPQEFVDRGWCIEKNKVFFPVSPQVWASTWKGVARTAMSRDFDQAMFLVGACFEGSGLKVSDTLNNPRFVPHPATGDLIDWLVRHGGNPRIKSAAQTARQLYQTWLSKRENQDKLRAQQLQFGFDEAGE